MTTGFRFNRLGLIGTILVLSTTLSLVGGVGRVEAQGTTARVRRAASGYNCATDPQSDGWAHLLTVITFENAGSCNPFNTTYTAGVVASEYIEGTDTTFSNASAEINTTAAHFGTCGFDSADGAAFVRYLATQGTSPDHFDLTKGRLGYWLKLRDGTSACPTSGERVGVMLANSTNNPSLSLIPSAGGAGAGYTYLARFRDNSGSPGTNRTTSDGGVNNIQIDEWHFVEEVWDTTLTAGNDFIRVKIDGVQVGNAIGTWTQINVDSTRFYIYGDDNCNSFVDTIWVSDDPTFDMYNHVVTELCEEQDAPI